MMTSYLNFVCKTGCSGHRVRCGGKGCRPTARNHRGSVVVSGSYCCNGALVLILVLDITSYSLAARRCNCAGASGPSVGAGNLAMPSSIAGKERVGAVGAGGHLQEKSSGQARRSAWMRWAQSDRAIWRGDGDGVDHFTGAPQTKASVVPGRGGDVLIYGSLTDGCYATNYQKRCVRW